MKKLVFAVALVSLGALLIPELSMAEVNLPSWAGNQNLESELSSRGQRVSTIISALVGILAVIGMLVGAAFFTMKKFDEGKLWLGGGAVGLVVAALVFGIAGVFV
ncbi:MAG: hypothetical protein FD165_2669 [Gammaproteobacteria bacterium]|nr:MAG: hypothetical protein FD165_2669 [Gammaproteobacteria bacterium]TND01142.1 MAG: hypothetical protein FD120_2678 [Gammaproteobacteria bacterium]